MKRLNLCLLSLVFSGCFSYVTDGVSYEEAIHETLISPISGKIMSSGMMNFIKYENNAYRLIQFDCRINVKKKTVSCRKVRDYIYQATKEHANNHGLYNSELFKKHVEKNARQLKYYKCFSDNFLDLSNDEKIVLMDQLSAP